MKEVYVFYAHPCRADPGEIDQPYPPAYTPKLTQLFDA